MNPERGRNGLRSKLQQRLAVMRNHNFVGFVHEAMIITTEYGMIQMQQPLWRSSEWGMYKRHGRGHLELTR